MKAVHFLLVEDNEGDIILTQEALEDCKILNTVSVARNGKEALDFVFKREKFINAVTPDIILLDINLPLKNGHEVLQEIKNNATVKHIPVIMFTTSTSEKDIQKSYEHQANCFISKPVEMDAFVKAINSLNDFWINIVTLPSDK